MLLVTYTLHFFVRDHCPLYCEIAALLELGHIPELKHSFGKAITRLQDTSFKSIWPITWLSCGELWRISISACQPLYSNLKHASTVHESNNTWQQSASYNWHGISDRKCDNSSWDPFCWWVSKRERVHDQNLWIRLLDDWGSLFQKLKCRNGFTGTQGKP